MKITMLSVADWAGSGYKLCEAVSRHTEHNIKLISQKGNAFGHPRGELLKRKNRKRLQMRINTSDIIHLKGDQPPSDVYIGLHIRKHIQKKKVIITTSGGFFRKKEYGGQGRFEHQMRQYKKAFCTSFEPDLLYPDYPGDTWIPHPIDSMAHENTWIQPAIPIIAHSPSNRGTKNTEFLLEVLKKLKKRVKFKLDIIENVSFKEAVERKRGSTLFADQFGVGGVYGNSAIEAMQFGIPVVCWMSEMARRQAPEIFKSHPVLSADKTVEAFTKLLERVLTNDMQELSNRTKKWCDEVHSYQAIAKQMDKIYKSL